MGTVRDSFHVRLCPIVVHQDGNADGCSVSVHMLWPFTSTSFPQLHQKLCRILFLDRLVRRKEADVDVDLVVGKRYCQGLTGGLALFPPFCQ